MEFYEWKYSFLHTYVIVIMHMVGDSVKKTNPGCANKDVEHPKKS